MGEPQSALDSLAAEDLHTLVAPQLDRTSELVRARNRIDAELARTTRAADLTQASEHDGLKTMRSWLRGHARLSPATAAQISRVIMGPDGQPLDHGRTKRIVPPPLRRAVELRDRHCAFAGCQAPTHCCDVHHVLERLTDTGETSLDNSALLCERHHTKVHHGFRVHRQPDNRWRTYSPDNTEILTAAPL